MNEHWSAIAYMAKAKESDLLDRSARLRENRTFKKNNKMAVKNNRKITTKNIPTYYFYFHRIGKYLINLGIKIENRYKTTNYTVDVIRLDA